MNTEAALPAVTLNSSYVSPDTDLTSDELRHRAHTGQATVLDVQPAEKCTAGHIPNALSIPRPTPPPVDRNFPWAWSRPLGRARKVNRSRTLRS